MNFKLKEVEQAINSELTSKIKKTLIIFDELLVETTEEDLLQVILFLKSHDKLKFRQLIDIAGVDYPEEEKRFKLIYLLLSHEMNKRIKISINFKLGKKIPTMTKVWPNADWYEREAFDLFGLMFIDHPDLRRLLTDYGFVGHPFRKDFPMIGKVEVRYDPTLKRVIYEPVSIDERNNVPRLIRDEGIHRG